MLRILHQIPEVEQTDSSDTAPTANDTRPCVPNDGSRGHPYCCRRPCLFFAAAQCEAGARCDYCHLDHEPRPPSLNKKQRFILQEFSRAEILVILLPHLEAKAEQMGQAADAAPIISSFHRELQILSVGVHWSTLSQRSHVLDKVLQKMKFGDVARLASSRFYGGS
ncbi:unnamed protein product, partial [Symbiodinium necroappetens]